ncbi:MAG TPA: hypothetical protein VK149_12255 [Sideroxyarcus sp.]|nr:hypothetical protein [Sideroxyarcus sp.]
MSAKDDILAAIAKTEDANMKVVLLLLHGVLDEISEKIDAMAADEKGLRAAVLNGHEPVHHAHHEYIARKMQYEDADAEQRRWVARKMQEEADDAKADKESKRAIRNAIIERLLWAAVVVIIGASGWVLN